jgi:hypothetical protein
LAKPGDWLRPPTRAAFPHLPLLGQALVSKIRWTPLRPSGDLALADDQQVWPAADLIAAWIHETALRLFPDSPYAKEHKAPGTQS